MNELLRVIGVQKRFGGYLALNDVSCMVAAGSIHALIGPNGAGKTTLFNIISGTDRPTQGEVRFAGTGYTGRRPDRVLAMGIARNFQQVRLFPGLSVVENVMVGCHARMAGGLWRDLVRVPFRTSRSEAQARDVAAAALDLVGMTKRVAVRTADLTLVEQRRLEIGRAWASDPALLLLDEPAAGMNPLEVAELGDLILRLQGLGKTILLVEHHMRLVMRVADRITVLSAGRVIADGTPAEVRRDTGVIAAYLGGAA